MKKRGDRTMTDLYDRTQKIPRLKIEGSSCKEPLDQPANETGAIKENNKSPSRKRSMLGDDNTCTKPESGTCNVCNTPCSSCRMWVETDTCSFVGGCSEHFHCENAETKSKFRNPNKPEPFDMGIVKEEGQGENTSCVTKHTKEKDTQRVDSRGESSSDNFKEAQGKKRFDSTDSREKSDSNSRVSQKNSVLHEKLFDGLENCDKRDCSEKDQMQGQKVVEVKNQETDNNGLIDVNVCDICGDTGREELLATCSRCIDGAEHTYCMRVRLEKLPEGDWLCEECQLKDKAEREKKRRIQTTPISTPRSEKENKNDLENSKNPFSRHKKLHISTDRAVYASLPPPSPHKTFKEVMSPRKTSNLSGENSKKTEIGSFKEVITPRKTSNLSGENPKKTEIGSFKEVITPRKTSNLSGGNLIKMEIGSPKGGSSGQIVKNSHALSRSYSLSNVSSLRDVEKGQAEMRPSKGTMTKHLSFKNPSMKPKVKSMTESIPAKQKTSIPVLKSTDEARPFRRLIKCSSLKETSSNRVNTDSVKLIKPPSPTFRVDSPKPLEVRGEREKISLEMKDSFKGENRTNVLATQPGTAVKKFESRAERSLPKKPECGTSCSYKEPALEDKKRSKPALKKRNEAKKNPTSVPVSKGKNKKFCRFKTAVRTVVPEARDGVKVGISDKPKEPAVESEVSHTRKNQKAISTNVEEHPKSRFSDRSRVEKAPKDVLSQASFLEKEESMDLDVVVPEARDGVKVGISGKPKAPASESEVSHTSKNQKATSTNEEEHPKSRFSDRSRVEKAPKDVLSPASFLEKEESVDLDVVVPEARDGVKVGISDKPKAPASESEVSHTSKNEKAISTNVEEHPKSRFSDRSRVEKAPKESLDLDVVSLNVGVDKMKAPKDLLSRSCSVEKERTVDNNVICTSAGVEKTKTHAKCVLSRASCLEKPMDLDVVSLNVGVEKMKAPKDLLSPSCSVEKERTVDSNEICTSAGVEKAKTHAKCVLSRASSLEKPMDLSGVSSGVGCEMTKAPMEMVDSNAISANVNDLDLKRYTPVVSADSSLLMTPLEAPIIPEQEFVWQGSFEIMQAKTQAWKTFNGIQAHLSTHVSPKVYEVLDKFSDTLRLEEVPCGTAWPVQFQKSKPSEENVALFFFARDLESYEVSYSRLLNSMIGDNLALRADICGAELLIFPSDKLSEESQRWNSLFFLWGTFRTPRRVPPKTILNSPKSVCRPSGNFPAKINEDVKPSKETIGHNLPMPKVEAFAGPLHMDLESCKKPVDQNAWRCLLPGASFCVDQQSPSAIRAASSTQICSVKPEDFNEKMASLPFLQRKTVENNSEVDVKSLSLEKPTNAELKPGNKRAHMSDETSYDELNLKRKREHGISLIETSHETSCLLNKPTLPKIHPLSIDLGKHAHTSDVYRTEDVKTANNVVANVISLDDEDVMDNKIPNLDLALGNKNPNQKEVLPLPLFPSVQPKEEDSDVVLSLSLTIGPPGSEKGEERPVMGMQQFLSEKPRVKAPLRLFGGYIDP